MPGSKAVKERIEELIAHGPDLSFYAVEAWLTSAQYAIQLVCPSNTDPYHARAKDITDAYHDLASFENQAAGMMPSWMAHEIGRMVALLSRLLEEIEGGLLTTIENHAIAVTFDNFLDHGAEYLKHGRKNEAAVIAGIVFEDTIRRICQVLGIAAQWHEIQLSDVKPVIDFTRELMAAHLE
jgi:hypothetical protein